MTETAKTQGYEEITLEIGESAYNQLASIADKQGITIEELINKFISDSIEAREADL